MPITVTAAGFPAALEMRLRQDTALVERVALEMAQRSLADAVKETNAADAVDQGLYKLAWSARRVPKGAAVDNTAPYAAVLEYGRRPGRPGPPLQPIIAWVNRKMRGDIKGQYRVAKAIAMGLATWQPGSKSFHRAAKNHVRETFGKQDSAVNAVVIFRAMAIRDSIHYRGTKPRRILQKVAARMGPRFLEAATRELRRKGSQ